MITPHEKAKCVSWFIESKSNIQTRRNYTTKYAKQALARQSIRNRQKQFMETGKVQHHPRSGKPSTSEEDIERIGQSFRGTGSPRKSIHTASVELQVPRSQFSIKSRALMRTKFRLQALKPRISDLVLVNQETHYNFSCGVNIFIKVRKSSILFI